MAKQKQKQKGDALVINVIGRRDIYDVGWNDRVGRYLKTAAVFDGKFLFRWRDTSGGVSRIGERRDSTERASFGRAVRCDQGRTTYPYVPIARCWWNSYSKPTY